MNVNDLKIACVVPTYNDVQGLTRLLDSLSLQDADFDLLIVDSSSTDGTTELAKFRSSNTLVIPKENFNHGSTRQEMVDYFPGYDIYVFLTQDVYFEDKDVISKVKVAFQDPKVAAVCGRQLPHHEADLFAHHARLFNYPCKSRVLDKNDIPQYGIKVAFLSNSFCAYRATALNEVGGFPDHVILSEDMYVAANLILADYKLLYLAEASCRHSHNYSLLEEFSRYFDIGVFHSREPWIRSNFGGVKGEGMRFIRSELKFLGFKRFYLWPVATARNASKLFAYKLGLLEFYLPLNIKSKISMHKSYWNRSFMKSK